MNEFRRIVYKEPDGRIFILCPTPSWGGTLEQLAEKDVKKGYEYALLESSQVPNDLLFMSCWNFDKNSNPVVSVDIEKAKLFWKDKWREARKPILEKLDVEFLQQLELGDTVGRNEVVQKKQVLRDITLIEIPGNTTQEIRNFWPEVLGPNPYASQ